MYKITKFGIFERKVGQNPVTVDIFVGKDGELTQVAESCSLVGSTNGSKSQETIIYIPAIEGDAVMFVFDNAGEYTGAESSYQIVELEAYGEKAEDSEISATGILPGYCYWESTNESIVIAYANATEAPINAATFIAAYEGDKMVAVCKSRDMIIPAGSVVAQYSMSVKELKAEGRTYKAFVFDSLEGLKPLMVSEIIG